MLSTNKKGDEDDDERFQEIEFGIPKIKKPDSEKGRKEIRKWLGELSRKVFAKGFKLFKKGEFNKTQKKAFCCENMIHNILSLMKENKMGKKEIKFIN